MSFYAPLPTEHTDIRLLYITVPENDAAIPKVTMASVPLDSNPRYYALSYVWGLAWVDDGLEVNGTMTHCTASLNQVLRQYRSLIANIQGNDEDIPLWVDAICINQQDLKERSAQVQLMKKIYQQAEGVIAWIGPEYQLGLRCLKILATEISSRPTSSISLSWLRDLKVDFCGAHYEQDSPNSGSGNFFWDAVNQFLNSPYWARIWILQEMTLAKKLYFICGSHTIQDEEIMTVWTWIDNIPRELKRPPFIDSSIWACLIMRNSTWLYWGDLIRPLQIRKLWQHFHQNNLPEKMQDALFDYKVGGIRMMLDQYWLKSTDPKDKIYGLLGLVEADIVPDYSLGVRDVYINFVQYWISKERTLNFLGVSGIGLLESRVSEYDLPSWVPNFVNMSAKIGLSEDSYGADAGHIEDERIIRTDRSSLFISGLAVDEISETRKITSIHEFCTYAWDIAIEDDDVNKVAMYPTGISRLQALFRVTVGDIDIFNGERPRLSQPGTESFDRLLNAFMIFHTLRIGEAGPSPGRNSNLPYIDLLLGPGASELNRNSPPLGGSDMEEYQRKYFQSTENNWVFWTKEGYLGVSASVLRAGDSITVAFGYSIPLVLRKVESHFELVGHCFILGYMDGEALRFRRSRGFEIQEIEIR
ncbi:hypothetical protein JMJ35_009235 [Cladonia borealis]|uniref:Heterokaryon incompatibility domain-containing protein n=1 Tax=Cladonia borealis TaxID=184061 RepID=A0AA39U5E1_9LECA|nr:hypothetical protein JMJ35_009235 [Cladonia borealis]